MDILNGEKTLEIRKSKPKCDLPIDVYIYCTKTAGNNLVDTKLPINHFYYSVTNADKDRALNGKVVAKFRLKSIETINYVFGRFCFGEWSEEYLQEQSCLTGEELFDYLKPTPQKNRKVGYAWHIDNLIVFTEPLELKDLNCGSAPQNYCFVEPKRHRIVTYCRFALREKLYPVHISAPLSKSKYITYCCSSTNNNLEYRMRFFKEFESIPVELIVLNAYPENLIYYQGHSNKKHNEFLEWTKDHISGKISDKIK